MIHLFQVDTILSSEAKKWIQVNMLQPLLHVATAEGQCFQCGMFTDMD